MRLSLAMAYRHVRAGFGRMALSVLAVALGVALVVAIQLMNAAVMQSFLDTVDAVSGKASLSISAGEGLPFEEGLVQRVAAVPGVKLAVPLVSSVAFPDDGSGELLTVLGVDLGQDAAVRLYHTGGSASEVIDDLVVFLSQPDSIVLGREFAQRRHLDLGSTIDLVTPGGVKRFTIRGLLDPQGLARTLGGRLVVMDLFAAERAFLGNEEVNQIDVVVADGASVEAVKTAVAQTLPPGLHVEEPALRKEGVRKTIGGFQTMLTAFGYLAVLAAFVICYSRLGAIFEARTWEVGLLRSVGLRQSVVFAELLKESLLLGAAGTVVGVPLGAFIGRHGLPFVATTTALNYRLPVPVAASVLSVATVALGAAVGLGAALLAAAIPALRLARKQPVAALTLRGRDTPGEGRARGWLFGPALLAVSAVLVVWQQAARLTALGNVTTALVAVAACAFAGPTVRSGGRLLSAVWERVFGASGQFAIAHLRQQARRATLTVATLGIGLGVVLMFGMLSWSFERTMIAQVAQRLRADLVVTSAFVSGGYVGAPISEAFMEELRAVPGVAVAAGEQQRDVRYGDDSVVLDAYDAVCFADTRVCQWIIEGESLADSARLVAAGEAVFVSSSFAHRYDTHPGDLIRLASPSGPVSFRVAGSTTGQPAPALVMSRDLYRKLWNDAPVSWVHVGVASGVDPAAVRRAIEERLGRKYRLRVRSGAELMEYFRSQVHQGFGFLYIMEVITFLLVLIAIGDTLATGVIDRTRELGMMRAVGLPRSRIFAMVMLEGTAIAVLGIALATGAGLTLGLFWVEVQFPAILGWNLNLHFPVAFSLTAAALTLALCLVGSLLPSLRAARLSIPAALRNE
jgi:putative ABC transport system permease protein